MTYKQRDNRCATCGHQFVEHTISMDGFRCSRCKCTKRHWRSSPPTHAVWCEEPDCRAKPHRLTQSSHDFSDGL